MRQRNTVDRIAWLGVVVAVCMILVGEVPGTHFRERESVKQPSDQLAI